MDPMSLMRNELNRIQRRMRKAERRIATGRAIRSEQGRRVDEAEIANALSVRSAQLMARIGEAR